MRYAKTRLNHFLTTQQNFLFLLKFWLFVQNRNYVFVWNMILKLSLQKVVNIKYCSYCNRAEGRNSKTTVWMCTAYYVHYFRWFQSAEDGNRRLRQPDGRQQEPHPVQEPRRSGQTDPRIGFPRPGRLVTEHASVSGRVELLYRKCQPVRPNHVQRDAPDHGHSCRLFR